VNESGMHDMERLLHDLQEDFGAEGPLPPGVERLLNELRPGNLLANRKAAALQLGHLDTSHPRILTALIELSESDKSYYVRRLAAQALQAPVHRELLRAHPHLIEAADRALREQVPQAAHAPPSYGGRSLTWSEIWVSALTRPSVATFERLLQDPSATMRRGYTWIAVIGLITFPSWLVMLVTWSLTGAATVKRWDSVIILSAVVMSLSPVVGFISSSAITHIIASKLGGTGTYSHLAYVFATYQAPLWLLFLLVSMIPYGGKYGTYAILFYGIVLSVLAVQAVHGFGLIRAIACVVIIPIFGVITGIAL
jgi:hypothetical protein